MFPVGPAVSVQDEEVNDRNVLDRSAVIDVMVQAEHLRSWQGERTWPESALRRSIRPLSVQCGEPGRKTAEQLEEWATYLP
jgi:hypothetical protein